MQSKAAVAFALRILGRRDYKISDAGTLSVPELMKEVVKNEVAQEEGEPSKYVHTDLSKNRVGLRQRLPRKVKATNQPKHPRASTN